MAMENRSLHLQFLRFTLLLLLGVQQCSGEDCHQLGSVKRCYSRYGITWDIADASVKCEGDSKKLLQLDDESVTGFVRRKFGIELIIGAWVAPNSKNENCAQVTSTPPQQYGKHNCTVITAYDIKRDAPCSRALLLYNIICYREILTGTTTPPPCSLSTPAGLLGASPGGDGISNASLVKIIAGCMVAIVVIVVLVTIFICVFFRRRSKGTVNNVNVIIMPTNASDGDGQTRGASEIKNLEQPNGNPPSYDVVVEQDGHQNSNDFASGIDNKTYIYDNPKGQKTSTSGNAKN